MRRGEWKAAVPTPESPVRRIGFEVLGVAAAVRSWWGRVTCTGRALCGAGGDWWLGRVADSGDVFQGAAAVADSGRDGQFREVYAAAPGTCTLLRLGSRPFLSAGEP